MVVIIAYLLDVPPLLIVFDHLDEEGAGQLIGPWI